MFTYSPAHITRVRVIRSVYCLQTELIEDGGGTIPDRETNAKKESEKRQHGSQVHLKPVGEALVKPQESPAEPPTTNGSIRVVPYLWSRKVLTIRNQTS